MHLFQFVSPVPKLSFFCCTCTFVSSIASKYFIHPLCMRNNYTVNMCTPKLPNVVWPNTSLCLSLNHFTFETLVFWKTWVFLKLSLVWQQRITSSTKALDVFTAAHDVFFIWAEFLKSLRIFHMSSWTQQKLSNNFRIFESLTTANISYVKTALTVSERRKVVITKRYI